MQNDKKQQEMKEEINMHLNKKDYYQILGIQKNATETQIKKAYKKLALRFHPDKNPVEGAKEVFKKVSNAYSTLVNPQKKADYDRFGPEEDRQPQYRPRHQHYRNQQDQFEEIFRAFFGGGVPHQRNGYTYTFNMGGGPRHRHENERQANAQPNFNFLHIFILLAVLYIIPLFFRQKATFSMSQDSEYRVKIESQTFRVPYYVRSETVTQLKQSRDYLRKINEKVETEYLISLYNECEMAERKRRSIEMKAYRYGPGQEREKLLRQSRKQDMSSCRKFSEIRENYGEYVRRLLNYY